jgi:hypothetical protein
MSDEYVNKEGYLHRYCLLWESHSTEYQTTIVRWRVCDRWDGHKVLAAYESRDEAAGVCKLMNSIEEETA